MDELGHGDGHVQDVRLPGVRQAGQSHVSLRHGKITGSCTHTLN